MKLIYNPAKGWLLKTGMVTGTVHFRTGQWSPTWSDKARQFLPRWLMMKIGPYPTAREAAECMGRPMP